MVLAFIFPFVTIFFKHKPKDIGLLPDGLMSTHEEVYKLDKGIESILHEDKVWPSIDWTIFMAIKTLRFWLIFLVNLFSGFYINFVRVHQVVYVVDIGYNEMLAASVFGLLGALLAMGSILGGIISDKMGRGSSYALSCTSCIIGIILLMSASTKSHEWMLYGYVIFFGLGMGAGGPISSALQADIFYGKNFGAIFGFFGIGFGLGGALGSWLGGLIFDLLGSYRVAFTVTIVIISLSAAFVWMIVPRRFK